MTDDTAQSLLTTFLRAFSQLDLDAMMSCVAEDATAFFPVQHQRARLEGKGAIGRAFGEVIARIRSAGAANLRLDPEDLLIEEHGDTAIATLHLRDDALCRRTFVLQRRGSQWFIIHLHASNAVFTAHAIIPQSCEVALLLVDIQRDFWRPLQDLPQFAAFSDNVRTLLDAARGNGVPVIHTHALFQPDGSDWMPFYGPLGRGPIPCIRGTPGAEIEAFALPRGDEIVISKQGFDGFWNTSLEDVLRARDTKTVIIAGLVTSVCVLFTAVAAYQRRHIPLVVSDACADSLEAHEATLRRYDGLTFRTATTAQVQQDLLTFRARSPLVPR